MSLHAGWGCPLRAGGGKGSQSAPGEPEPNGDPEGAREVIREGEPTAPWPSSAHTCGGRRPSPRQEGRAGQRDAGVSARPRARPGGPGLEDRGLSRESGSSGEACASTPRGPAPRGHSEECGAVSPAPATSPTDTPGRAPLPRSFCSLPRGRAALATEGLISGKAGVRGPTPPGFGVLRTGNLCPPSAACGEEEPRRWWHRVAGGSLPERLRAPPAMRSDRREAGRGSASPALCPGGAAATPPGVPAPAPSSTLPGRRAPLTDVHKVSEDLAVTSKAQELQREGTGQGQQDGVN